jgi:hypothetical protein
MTNKEILDKNVGNEVWVSYDAESFFSINVYGVLSLVSSSIDLYQIEEKNGCSYALFGPIHVSEILMEGEVAALIILKRDN